MYVCFECGKNFLEFSTWTEPHGEKMCGCPYCHGAFDDGVKCEICGEYFTEEELINGVCEECIDDYGNNFETCLEISRGEKEDIKINAFLASVLSIEEIEEVLIEYIKNEKPNVNCKKFINEDINWFTEKLREVII